MSRRTALCVGINYPGTSAELYGCRNDAEDWSAALRARGYEVNTLLDDHATRAAMMAAISSIVGTAERGDTVVITFSGHGTYVADTSGDEPDGADEALCPADVFAGYVITDDELADVFQNRERGVRLVLVSDSCHSGTVARYLSAPSGAQVSRIRFLPPRSFTSNVPLGTPRVRSRLVSSALLLSGCRDHEYSYDAWFGGRANGAMTRAALDTLANLPAGGATFRQWHKNVRAFLPSASYPQSPQLFGTSTQKGWRVF